MAADHPMTFLQAAPLPPGDPAWLPPDAAALVTLQEALGSAAPPAWTHESTAELPVAGCFVCFARGGSGPGAAGDPGWAGAALVLGGALVEEAAAAGVAGAPYEAGLLALREAPLLLAALAQVADDAALLLVNGTGRDHPRRAGLAVHLGAALGLPSIGITHRPLFATGAWPPDTPGAASPLTLDGELVGHWLRARAGVRPVAVHAGWRTAPDAALAVARTLVTAARTPEPLRHARHAARVARSNAHR